MGWAAPTARASIARSRLYIAFLCAKRTEDTMCCARLRTMRARRWSAAQNPVRPTACGGDAAHNLRIVSLAPCPLDRAHRRTELHNVPLKAKHAADGRQYIKRDRRMAGLKPAIFGLEVRRHVH